MRYFLKFTHTVMEVTFIRNSQKQCSALIKSIEQMIMKKILFADLLR